MQVPAWESLLPLQLHRKFWPALCACLIWTWSFSSAYGACEFGVLPGTWFLEDSGKQTWKVFDKKCQLKDLLPAYLGLDTGFHGSSSRQLKDVSMVLLGDSVDRSTVWDTNDTALSHGNTEVESLLNEHWRVALSMPHLEMVYQFAPGSHIIGPYHDDVPWNMTVVNALPRGFELHRLLTGRPHPNIVVMSNMLWDLGRWLFLSEIAEPERMDFFGLPLLREQEFIPLELLEEFRNDTELQMLRIQEHVSHDTLLIYHNAAFAKLKNCTVGTDHVQKGMGKRTHLAQLNALARQIVAENPRWHLVDIGPMSEPFLSGSHLRDEHHPNPEFLLQLLNIYLNLHEEFGVRPPAATQAPGDVAEWDREYIENAEKLQKRYLQSTEIDQHRLARMQAAEEAHAGRTHEASGKTFTYSWHRASEKLNLTTAQHNS